MGTSRVVYRRDDGQWVNKRTSSERASSLHGTRSEAEKSAKEMLRNSGGGELTVKGADGKIRKNDTVPSATDSYPPIDQERAPARGDSYHVVSHAGGKWSVRKTGEGRASRVFDTRSDAISFARSVAKDTCGEIIIHGRDGRIRETSSYGRGIAADPYPPRSKS